MPRGTTKAERAETTHHCGIQNRAREMTLLLEGREVGPDEALSGL
jgi:hypothetical protein